jgi:hypothetical protein
VKGPWVPGQGPLEELDLTEVQQIHGTDVHPVPPQMVELAEAAWATAGAMLDAGVALLAGHKAESPHCPGAWCPGVRVEASLQQMDRWQLEALLSVALHRLWAADQRPALVGLPAAEEPWATCATDTGGCGGNLLGRPARVGCRGAHAQPWQDDGGRR